MAGERQHYIPRFLLKGFSSRTTSQKVFVWYFRKGENPIEVSIRDIALEKSFYSESGKGSLDEAITENEKDYAPVISQVREEGYISERDLNILLEFVFNLVIRTRNIRKGLTETLGTFINMFSRNISNPHTAARLLENYRKENKEKFRNRIRIEVRKSLGYRNPKVEELAIWRIEENLQKMGALGPFFSTILDKFLSGLQQEGEKAHKKALTRIYQTEESSEKLSEYRRLRWSVKRFEPNTFILGDIGVAQFNFKTKEFHPSILNKIDEGALLLPIGHDTLLVGISDDNLTLPSPDDINTGIAELSMDFFVASSNGEREKAYSEIMGTRATLLDDKTANELERKYL
ncbi:MAG: DUF4238 domain-containing protein [Thermodesulfobacteriota bacterium]